MGEEVAIPIKLLLDDRLPAVAVIEYAKLKAGLKADDKQLSALEELGYIKRRNTKNKYQQIDRIKRKIRRFQIGSSDFEPFSVRWTHLVNEMYALHKEYCVTHIMFHLRKKLMERSDDTGIDMVLPPDWRSVWRGYSLRMVNQYPSWHGKEWEEAIDWFINDKFWGDVVIDTKTMSKHLQRYIVWKQRREPHKKKLSALKVIR